MAKLESGKIYTFQNVADSRVLDLHAANLEDGTMIHAYDDNKSPAQQWRLEIDDVKDERRDMKRRKDILLKPWLILCYCGLEPQNQDPLGYKLVTVLDDPNNIKKCISMSKDADAKCVLKEFNGDDEQFWRFAPIPDADGEESFQILNILNNNALISNGVDRNVSCIPSDPKDTRQQWKFIPVV